MKKYITSYLISLLAFFLFSCSTDPLVLNVATYNIRNENSYDSLMGNAWSKRCPYITQQILYNGWDIIGTQECLHHQLEDLKAGLRTYNYIGVGRDDGHQAGEYCAILYNTQRIEVLESGNFWLSLTPETPSLGWDATCIRICTWGRFKEKGSDQEFMVFNTHMDHVGVEARIEGAYLVMEKIKELSHGSPYILTGDFNVNQHHPSYKTIAESGMVKEAYNLAEIKYTNNGTFNAFDTRRFTKDQIDHIFVSDDFSVKRYGILTDCYWSVNEADSLKTSYDVRFPSDHFPVTALICTQQ